MAPGDGHAAPWSSMGRRLIGALSVRVFLVMGLDPGIFRSALAICIDTSGWIFCRQGRSAPCSTWLVKTDRSSDPTCTSHLLAGELIGRWILGATAELR